MNIPAKKFGARDVSPVDQVRIDKKIISLGIEQADSITALAPMATLLPSFADGSMTALGAIS